MLTDNVQEAKIVKRGRNVKKKGLGGRNKQGYTKLEQKKKEREREMEAQSAAR